MAGLIRRLYLRWRDRHDPAWAPTGYRRTFEGHDEKKAVDAARRADQHAKLQRKAAAKRALPRAARRPAPVTEFRRRAR